MSTYSTFVSNAIFLYTTIGPFCVNDGQNKTLDIVSQKSSSLCLSFQLRKQQHILLKSQTSTSQISLSSYVQSASKSYKPYLQHTFSMCVCVCACIDIHAYIFLLNPLPFTLVSCLVYLFKQHLNLSLFFSFWILEICALPRSLDENSYHIILLITIQ